jgi:hypothetical protein
MKKRQLSQKIGNRLTLVQQLWICFHHLKGLSVFPPVAHCLVAQTLSFLMRVLLLAHSFLAGWLKP